MFLVKTMNRMDSNRDDDKYIDSRRTYQSDKLVCNDLYHKLLVLFELVDIISLTNV